MHDARRYQNVQNSSAGHRRLRERMFVEYTVADQQGQGLNKAENAAQQQRPFMDGRHAKRERLELRSLGSLEC